MADGFEALVDTSIAFFSELRDNNSKDWFAPRKEAYKRDIQKPAELLGELIAEDLSRLTGHAHKPKLFRIYRDVRFSKDKTPLNAHLHLMWSATQQSDLSPAFFFGLSPDYFLMGGGIMGMKGPALAQFRAHIDAQGDALQNALERAAKLGVSISDWGPEPLKRVPKPFAQDHPHGALLKRKALAVHAPIDQNWREVGLVKAINARIAAISPVLEAMSPH